jgi:hypothetical protein
MMKKKYSMLGGLLEVERKNYLMPGCLVKSKLYIYIYIYIYSRLVG